MKRSRRWRGHRGRGLCDVVQDRNLWHETQILSSGPNLGQIARRPGQLSEITLAAKSHHLIAAVTAEITLVGAVCGNAPRTDLCGGPPEGQILPRPLGAAQRVPAGRTETPVGGGGRSGGQRR